MLIIKISVVFYGTNVFNKYEYSLNNCVRARCSTEDDCFTIFFSPCVTNSLRIVIIILKKVNLCHHVDDYY
jgi:hypothetical protein